MNLIQLRYLVAIADAGLNITLAATRVHATQPGLSKQLRQLEDELGFQLFLRKGKSLVMVTAAGEQVLVRARNMLDEAANIRSIAANLRNESSGELRIATTHTQARFALPNSIAGLSARYPQVSVHLQPTRDAEVLAQLEAGHVDMAIISSPGTPPAFGLALPVYRWRRVILMPVDHPLSQRDQPPSLEELSKLALVSYDSSLTPESSLRRSFKAAGLEPQIVMTAGDADLIKTYVRAGLGIGILAEMAILPSDDDLRWFCADQLFPECTTWVVLRREGVLRDYALDFIGELAPHLDRRDIVSALTPDGSTTSHWPTVPHWRELHPLSTPEAAACGAPCQPESGDVLTPATK